MRTRLTLWYTAVLAVVLIAFSAGVYSLTANKLRARLDAGMQTTIEGIARLLVYEIREGENEAQAIHSALNEHYFPNQAAAIFDTQGQLLEEKPLPTSHHAELPSAFSLISKEVQLSTRPQKNNDKDDSVRIAAQRVTVATANKSYLIVVGEPLDSLSEDLELLRGIFLAAVPVALVLAGLSGWFLARKSLAPVAAMSGTARRISAERLEQRLPVANPRDELGQMAATFNELLARLESSFAQQRQFMADASHELRTPLHVIRTAAEVTLEQSHREEHEYREALAMVDQQARRLTRIVEDMFTLARADVFGAKGQRDLERREFYLDELVAEAAGAASILAARKGVTVAVANVPDALFRGDEGMLRQMLLNLLDNAIKYTPAGGEVRAGLARHNGTYEITVADTGTGIPADSRDKVFERFYRVDKARARAEILQGGGAGLGLSIARWIAEAHNGSLQLKDSDQTGSTFVASLPVSGNA